MKDTSKPFQSKFRNMLMNRSGEERFIMGCSMYDSAKQIVKSSILAKHPEISDEELKIFVFNRFYGREFLEEQKKKIFAIWKIEK